MDSRLGFAILTELNNNHPDYEKRFQCYESYRH